VFIIGKEVSAVQINWNRDQDMTINSFLTASDFGLDMTIIFSTVSDFGLDTAETKSWFWSVLSKETKNQGQKLSFLVKKLGLDRLKFDLGLKWYRIGSFKFGLGLERLRIEMLKFGHGLSLGLYLNRLDWDQWQGLVCNLTLQA
jgi:hypothetical protein